MKFTQEITLKNGKTALLRNGVKSDGQLALDNFILTHSETDYLLSYPDENKISVCDESDYLMKKAESDNEIELVAIVDGKLVAMAGIDAVGTKYKLEHRAEFGIAVAKAYWGLGLGSAMTKACIVCAKQAGYTQLELSVVAENENAIALYHKLGFKEYGRNPKGFRSRKGGYQELVYMLLQL